MSELGNVIVGYPQSDPRLAQLWEQHGHRALPHRGCMNCGVVVYFVQSGVDAIRSKDPEVICDRCWSEQDVKADIYAEL